MTILTGYSIQTLRTRTVASAGLGGYRGEFPAPSCDVGNDGRVDFIGFDHGALSTSAARPSGSSDDTRKTLVRPVKPRFCDLGASQPI
jgi:hypothetical protein